MKAHLIRSNGWISIVGFTTGSGSLVNNERYQDDPYGNLLVAPVSPKLQANPWRFASGYFDSATGFTKFGVRYYDATTGRWTQQDPKAGSLFDPRSSNRYVYAKCDPVNAVDPSGRSVFSFLNCLGGWILGIIGIVGAATVIMAIGTAIIGAIATLNPLIGMFIFMAVVLAAALATGAAGVNIYNTGIAPSCGYQLLT